MVQKFKIVFHKVKYAIIPYLIVLFFQSLVYFSSKLINSTMYKYDFTLGLDRKIPLISAFSVIYLGCYIWWAVTPLLVAYFTTKKNFYRYIFAHFLGFLIAFLFYIIIPTTTILPVIENTDFFSWLNILIYKIDTPVNLFPSLHCMISYFCFLAFRGQKKLPKFLVSFQLLLAILVCISTQFTKQHYIVDAIGAVLIAEIIYIFVRNNPIHFMEVFFTKINKKFKMDTHKSDFISSKVTTRKKEKF